MKKLDSNQDKDSLLEELTSSLDQTLRLSSSLQNGKKPDRRYPRWPPDALLLNGKYPMISPSDISTVASRVLAQYDVSEAYLFGSFARG